MGEFNLNNIIWSYICGLITGLMLSVLMFAVFTSERISKQDVIEWSEKCWPNKPSWRDPYGTCLINEQRVIVE